MPNVKLFASLKFRIVVLALVTGVAAALGAATLVLDTTEAAVRRMLLASDRHETERAAALLGSKLETLKHSLVAVSRQAGPELWRDGEAMQRFLLDRAALGALFDTLLAVGSDGEVHARVERGRLTSERLNIADREYFQQVMRSDQPVVSDPLRGKVIKAPLVIVAAPVLAADGRTVGTIAGSLRLQSNSLFTDLGAARQDAVRDLVIDRHGTLLAHNDPDRVLGHARDEAGLAEVFARWHGSGSPIDIVASSELSQDHLVSVAGIPLSDWVLVRMTPSAVALAPMREARRTSWVAALIAGLLSAALAGAVAWLAVRPIERLRNRAERMLHQADASAEGWPIGGGEIGLMAAAFQQLLQQRERQRSATQAVLENAEIGIALTRNGRFELVSRRFCAIFQCEPSQVVGQPTRLIYGSDEAYEALSQRARPAFMQQGVFEGEVELVRRNGEAFWAQMRGRAVAPGDRTQGTIWVFADVTQERHQHQQLSWAASHDKLTGLLNRAAFEVLLEEAAARATEQPFCALFIDLDRFKQVNDSGGHAAGDALLRDIAHALAARLRKADTVARLGGDEFAVLLPQCPMPQARLIAEKLRATVEDYRLEWEGRSHGVGASIGVVVANGTHAGAADVLREADAACYDAKRRGRNCVAVAVA